MDGFYRNERGKYLVRDMVKVCQDKEVRSVPLTKVIHNLSYQCWSDKDNLGIMPWMVLTDRGVNFARHERRIQEAELSYAIIITEDYDIMDGMHRLCKAYRENRRFINCVIITEKELCEIRRSL
jgi:hypothetical protein